MVGLKWHLYRTNEQYKFTSNATQLLLWAYRILYFKQTISHTNNELRIELTTVFENNP